ncbi:class I adenylate-forming enzyme family protein [Paenarthrobacter histidinolovorans]|uniref:class I adenylate-forming enzyme family protein n=1 Tax=Paenarthrobacter histidinolovorans TaxID=43664 RepID=UPI00166AC27A|nr:class I adenylate-forming enzyme family protein [Paenarthrobacter histidinolovorans]GGJ21959.1 long-chain-fatty-acid--CoA ligase [Paenarthrobacter histidinolovorans]
MNQNLKTTQGSSSPEVGAAVQALHAHALEIPDRIAVRDSRTALTWRELEAEVLSLAQSLQADGVGNGSPMLLLLDSCVESIVAYWAVRELDATVILADPGCTRAEYDHYVAATQPGWVFSTRSGTWERLGLADDAQLQRPSMTWFIQDSSAELPLLRPWQRRELRGEAPKNRFEEAPSARLVLFSSGTTGQPKTILHTDASVLALHNVHTEVWKLSSDDVVLGCLPFHNIYGSIYTAASAIFNGATLALMERFKPDIAMRRIQEWRVTTMAMVPAMMVMMLNAETRNEADFSTLRVSYTGGAPVSDPVMEAFQALSGAPVLASYGLTECPGAAVEPFGSTHGSGVAGRICPGFEAVARNSSGDELSPGEVGEITLRGPSQMLSYLGQPELTQQRIRGGWVYSQDIGFVDEEGNIHVSGRAGDMIIRGGLNIAPKEIEDVLVEHPDVVTAAVVGVEDAVLGQTVKAFVVPRPNSDLTTLADSLRRHCAEKLSRAKIPESTVFLAKLPMNAGGKVLRSMLSDPDVGQRITVLDASSLPTRV